MQQKHNCYYIFNFFTIILIAKSSIAIIMEESVQKRKIIELEHLLQQNKIYQFTYQGKSLQPKQALTYLEFTKHIAQLAPTIQSHYLNQLSHDQNKNITDVISNLFMDILQKLKGLVDCLERKEIPKQFSHEMTDICQVCQQQLMKQKVSRVKQSLTENQGLAQQILNMIKQVQEETEPFSFDQDNIFFKELKIALEKKQEVLDMCNKQSEDCILHIEDQLRELIKTNQIFSCEKNGRQLEGDVKKGRVLKQSVISSLKVNIKGKFPIIIHQIMKILLAKQQQERLLKRKEIEIQTITIEHGNPKLNEMKKKITEMTKSNNQCILENEKLQEIINKKEALIHKLEKQLNELQQQFVKKTLEWQRNFKDLEKNKNTEYNMSKSRLDLLSRQTSDKIKSIKSLHKLRDMIEQSTVSQISVIPMISILATEQPDTSEVPTKDKNILNSTLKGSKKLIFPTLTRLKIIDQSQLIPNLNSYKQNSQIDLIKKQIKGQNEPKHSIMLPKLQNQFSSKNGLPSLMEQDKEINKQKKLADQIQLKAKNQVNQYLNVTQNIQIRKNVKTERYTQMAIFQNKKQNYMGRGQKSSLQKVKSPKNKNKKQISGQTSLIKIKNHKSFEYGQPIKEKKIQGINTSRSHKMTLKRINKEKQEDIYQKENIGIHVNAQLKKDTKQKGIAIKRNNQQLQKKQHNNKILILKNDFQKITEQYDKQNFNTPANRESEKARPSGLSPLSSNSIRGEIQKIYDLLNQQGTINIISKDQFKKLLMIYLNEIAKKGQKFNASLSQEKKDNFDFNHQLETLTVLNSQIVKKEKNMVQQRHLREMKILKHKMENHSELQKQDITVSAYVSQHTSYETNDKSKSINQENEKKTRQPQQFRDFFTDYNNLFANQEMAYRYQISFSKKILKMPVMTPELKSFALNLFERLQELKYLSNISYQQICSFMRYPFSNSKRGCLQIDIIQNISLIALTQCFQRIAGFHKKCKNEGGLCTHLINFYKQIQDTVNKLQ